MRTIAFCLMAPLMLVIGNSSVAAATEPAKLDVEVIDSSFQQQDGTRVLQQSVVVPASLNEVWEAFTTAEGLKSWAVPFAVVDFREGGYWETSYSADSTAGDPANIRSRIISFLPKTMLSIKAEQAPPGFPHPKLLPSLFSVFTFEEMEIGADSRGGDNATRVTASGVGYGPGPGYDELYNFFTQGNAWTLRRLHQRFAEGPVDWKEAFQPKSEQE